MRPVFSWQNWRTTALHSYRETVTMSQWRYAGSGHDKGEHFWAEIVRQQVSTTRRVKRENERRQASQS